MTESGQRRPPGEAPARPGEQRPQALDSPGKAGPGGASAAGPRWWVRPATTRSFVLVMSVASALSVAALVVGARPLFQAARNRRAAIAESGRVQEANRATARARARSGGSSGAAVLVRVGAAGASSRPRNVASEAPELLAAGERIRIAVQPGPFRFLFVFSIDDRGVTTALFPDAGDSLAVSAAEVAAHNGVLVLPESLELAGPAGGARTGTVATTVAGAVTGPAAATERLVILLTDEPLAAEVVKAAATAAFRAAGQDLKRFPRLAVTGEQFHRLFIKTPP